MEQRFNHRMEITSFVLVFQKQIGWIKALVKNVSTHGMLVDTGRSTLPKGTVVELAGPAAWQLESKMGLPKAMTIHSKDGKAGLMLIATKWKIADLSRTTNTIGLKKRSVQ